MSTIILEWKQITIFFAARIERFTNCFVRTMNIKIAMFSHAKNIMFLILKFKMHFFELIMFISMSTLIWRSFTRWNSFVICVNFDCCWSSNFLWKYKSKLQYANVLCILNSMLRIFNLNWVLLMSLSETFLSRNSRFIKNMKIFESAQRACVLLFDSNAFFTRAYWCSLKTKSFWFLCRCVEITIEIFSICFWWSFEVSRCFLEFWFERRCLCNLLFE